MKFLNKLLVPLVLILLSAQGLSMTQAQSKPEIPRFQRIEVSALNDAKQFARDGDTIVFDIHFREPIIIRDGEVNFTIGQDEIIKTVSFSENERPGKHFQLQYLITEGDEGIIKISAATFTTDAGLKTVLKGPYALGKTVQVGELFPEYKDAVLNNIEDYEYSLATAYQENRGYAARKSTYVNRYGETITVGIRAGRISTEDLKKRSTGYQQYLQRKQNTSVGIADRRFESTPISQVETLLRKRQYMKEKNSPLDS